MNKPTWKIHSVLSRRKTAAQVALTETKQYKQKGNHQHMILKACNTQSETQHLKGQLLANQTMKYQKGFSKILC